MPTWISSAAAGICLLVVSSSFARAGGEEVPRVLLVHSYDSDFEYSTFLGDRVIDSLQEEFPALQTHIYYLDSKQVALEKSMEVAARSLPELYGDLAFDAAVAFDDSAFRLLSEAKPEFLREVPVFFTGLSDRAHYPPEAFRNAAGIVSEYPLEKNFDLILNLFPNTRRILFLSDQTNTGRIDSERAVRVRREGSFPFQLEVIDQWTVGSLRDILREAGPDTVLFLSPAYVDRNGLLISPRMMSALLDDFPGIPTFAGVETFVDARTIGGWMPIREMVAAQLANKVARFLRSGSLEGIDPLTEADHVPFLSRAALERHGRDEADLPYKVVFVDPAPSLRELAGIWFYPCVAGLATMVLGFLLVLDRNRRLSRTKRKLQESLSHLEVLGQFAPVGFFLANGEGEPTWVSESLARMLGREREHLTGPEVFDLLHPDDRRALEERRRTRDPSQGGAGSRRVRLRATGGDYRLLECIYSAVTDEAGKTNVYAGTVQDITEKERDRERLVLLSSIVENAGDGVLVSRVARTEPREPRIEYANRAFLTNSGYSFDEIQGRSPRMFYGPGTDEESARTLSEAIRAGQAARVEILQYRRDGVAHWTEMSLFPVADESEEGRLYVSIQRDTTQRRQNEEDLQRATREALRANEAKNAFLSLISHEMRTPLVPIVGFADLLASGDRPDEDREAVEAIRAGAESLNTLINNLLLYVRLETEDPATSREEVSLDDCVAGIRRHAFDQARRTPTVSFRLNLTPRLPKAFLLDKERCAVAITQLISNAFKFTSEGSVEVNIDWVSDRLLFEIRDTGIGMTAEEVSRIFEPFHQSDGSNTRRYGGIGIGLSLCRKIIHSLGGEIHVESSPGKGSVFRLEVPAPRADGAGEVPREPDTATGRRILIVDDEPANRFFFKTGLEQMEHHPVLAESGPTALMLLEQDSFDLVLLDLLMPGMSGFETLREIRSKLGRESPPVVAVTACALDEDRRRCREAGFDDFLTKPVSIEELGEVVQRHATRPASEAR